MKTFNDLEFSVHPNYGIGFSTRAKMLFDNGYGVSVITGDNAYTSGANSYELAVLKVNCDGEWGLCHDTHITDDVLGYLTDNDVTEIMKKVQEL